MEQHLGKRYFVLSVDHLIQLFRTDYLHYTVTGELHFFWSISDMFIFMTIFELLLLNGIFIVTLISNFTEALCLGFTVGTQSTLPYLPKVAEFGISVQI